MTRLDSIMALSPVIPVLVLDDADDAVALGEALVAGGLRVIEVTLRTPAAPEAIRRMSRIPGAVVGAGTVLDADDARRAADAGAEFLIAPGLTDGLARAAAGLGLPFLPGVASASDVMRGRDHGLDRFKFFPAEAAGGVAMLKSLGGPFPAVRFCPTGGITPASAPTYLALSNVACVGGGWMTPAPLIAARDWAGITGLAHAAAGLRGA